jgi:hypothetical protein
MRDYEAQIAQMNIIGPQITRFPWAYLNGKDPGRAYDRARQHALVEIGKPAGPVAGGRPSL